jgi:YCII-related domain
MKKFLVIYGSPVSAREQMAKATPEQAKAGMEAWLKWSQKAAKAIVDLGAPLSNSATVAPNGKTTDSQSTVGGFSILQAESREAVTALLVDHPHFMMPGATLEVHELLPLPGM